MIPVTAIPVALQPDKGRIIISLPPGWTVAEIIDHILPGLPESALSRLRVTLVTPDSMLVVERPLWHLVRPKDGVALVIRVVPGKQALQLLVSIAAVAVAGFFAPGLAAALGIANVGLVKSILTLGLTALGGLLINALFPAEQGKKDEKAPFVISGWRNEYRPDAPVPVVLGVHRFAPPFAAFSWLEVVGDILYNRAAFLWGYAPLAVSNLKIGDTPIDKFDELQIEELGYGANDTPTIYTQQVVEESIGTDLTRPYERDDKGDMVTPEATVATPVSRFTGRDVTHAIAILSFPSGLVRIDDKNRKNHVEVVFGLRYRLNGEGAWTEAADVTIRANKTVGFYRAVRIDFPTRGRYEVEFTRETPSEKRDSNTNQFALDCNWVVLQSFRPEYPFNFAKDVAITAVRVKATHQLNGALDSFNGVVSRLAPDWTPEDWYVDSAVAVSGDGQSWATAWKQPSDIVWGERGVSAGHTVHFSGGSSTKTYEPLVVGASGTADERITLTRGTETGHNGKPIFDGGAAAIAIDTELHRYLTLSGLGAQNSNDTAVYVDTPVGVIVEDCEFTGNGAAGGNARGLDARHGSSTNCLIVRRCTIDTSENTTSQTDCIYLQDMDGVVIHDNTIIVLNADNTGHSDGIQVYDCGDVDIWDNDIEVRNGGPDNHGIFASDCRAGKRYIIRGNVVWMRGANPSSALTHWNEPGWTGRSEILNNTVVGGERGINLETVTTVVKNNIVASQVAGGWSWFLASVTIEADHNLTWEGSATVARVDGVNKDWAAWQALGHDASGVNADPLFTNEAFGTFTLLAGSPAIDAGEDVGLEFNGAAPDIGARESS